MGRIVIDGRTFEGNSISIRNGHVVIDGVAQDGQLSGVVEVRIVEGVLGKLECDASVTCGEVRGDISAGGSVRCGNVSGSVSAGGSVTCANAGANISAGGSVRINK